MRVIVTGGNSGVGKATVAALAAAGHSVVMACRTIPKGEQAAAEMSGDIEVRHLDLADLSSVRAFADSIETVDVLVNNAGVLGLPLTRTADGFEAHMGTNHLGHFALTCQLGDKITDRVISVSSALYILGRIHLDDLNWNTRNYSMWAAYAQSKQATMLFINELGCLGELIFRLGREDDTGTHTLPACSAASRARTLCAVMAREGSATTASYAATTSSRSQASIA